MKELSIEGKARAHDEVREKIAIRFGSNVADEIFSQFEMSEDERIRKELIKIFEVTRTDGYNVSNEEAIAWLEKQGEQKPTDKVEPKFKVGDWITNGEYTWKVTDIQPLDYILQSQNGDVVDDTISHVDEHFHLWTIQDAKDGDVLVVESRPFIYDGKVNPLSVGGYCGIAVDGILKIYEKHLGYGPQGWTAFDTDIYPATKEQRDALMKAMADSGYTFDFKKKRLKKIEQKPAEWSEEDENKRLTMKLIDKDAVIAEIERKKICAQTLGDNAINGSMQQFYDGMKQGFVDILSFLNTLEVKEFHISKNNLENYQNN